jgi:hypothetical protein
VTQPPERDTPDAPASVDARADDRADKKERVLHTRVPAVLERELKRFADNLRVPVSNLVRTILEDAVKVADAAGTGLEERLKQAASAIEHERERLKKRMTVDRLAGIFAYQDVTLAQPTECAQCDQELARGTRAHLGLHGDGDSGGARVIVCDTCLPRGAAAADAT